ncbi:hypothetical protein F3Y22_tig00112215pilonHSYRG00189 [Hibiscus syriacus]|uniref:Protein MAINTENANCE OF PSII UNDER HIGH LIGHT 1 n=1 Tax=Hibiscus syriacus TaxID=106335 RepID=A0A6A2X4X6_HIBSY|nr:protein MAINTENANCE OF PSII UNDER HIGH LIGHT 1-like [Hibiscus syriacus]KAE8669878.1 hypothetical protein F3Y22_tig00112215pilonHSYRG00189 [Hibiscus syriacus]
MAFASQAMISTTSYAFPSPKLLFLNKYSKLNRTRQFNFFAVRASSDEPDDCNEEECAPDKEVGKVSVEWLAGDKTKVVGTFPPRKRGWTGYVKKDTAGQTNIYSVEPAVYVAESAISSGTAGSSSQGSENTAAVAAGFAVIFVAAASSIVLQVGKNSHPVKTVEYTGPTLSYYINKFKPTDIIQAAAPSVTETPSSELPENSAPQVSEVQVQSELQPEPSSLSGTS